jgi:hypothetical protein
MQTGANTGQPRTFQSLSFFSLQRIKIKKGPSPDQWLVPLLSQRERDPEPKLDLSSLPATNYPISYSRLRIQSFQPPGDRPVNSCHPVLGALSSAIQTPLPTAFSEHRPDSHISFPLTFREPIHQPRWAPQSSCCTSKTMTMPLSTPDRAACES